MSKAIVHGVVSRDGYTVMASVLLGDSGKLEFVLPAEVIAVLIDLILELLTAARVVSLQSVETRQEE